jgi:hypothetical protein
MFIFRTKIAPAVARKRTRKGIRLEWSADVCQAKPLTSTEQNQYAKFYWPLAGSREAES